MKGSIYNIDGKVVREIELPKVFETEYNPVLIRKVVNFLETHRLQRKGASHRAGRDYVIEYVGRRHLPHSIISRDIARRKKTKERRSLILGRATGTAGTRGGPKAHPLRPEKKPWKKINKKEIIKARKSAIAATALKERVRERGHLFRKELRFPIIVESGFENLKKSKDFKKLLRGLGVEEDVERAKKRKVERAGKGKMRGRRYKRKKSLLVVVSEEGKNIEKAARNLEGVDVVPAKKLSVRELAPGTMAGRLTLWSEETIKLFGKKKAEKLKETNKQKR